MARQFPQQCPQQRRGRGGAGRRRLWQRGGLLVAIAVGCWSLLVAGAGATPIGAAPSPSTAVMASLFGPLFAGQRPNSLGVHDGQLSACPPSPNCVSTTAAPTDLSHAIAPLTYDAADGAAADQAWQTLTALVQDSEGVTLVTATEDYLYAEFTTPLMGFVDDVEFHRDRAASEIQVRSASRLGESDLGLNRQRIERIRGQFERQQRLSANPLGHP
ncbi:MAG: DUF1499 domain-containing protein [Cyanobacteria bacterium]|nr:DUF1499 domain-containing protein [Cyanobacteriota bacterium]